MRFISELEAFNGDVASFQETEELLRPCLIVAQTGRAGRRSSRLEPRERAPWLKSWFSAKRLVLVVAMLSIVAIAVFAVIALTSP